MAKARHKSNGCRRGQFKAKRMNKGWSTLRKQRGRPLPVKRDNAVAEGEKPAS